MRLREPKTTALVFASGKMVCTGAKTEEASRTAARKYARIIQKLGNPVSFQNFAIQNIVGSVDVKFAIDLEQISNEHNQFCTYEPEIFPGLVYRMLDPKIVILIFVSGKLVLLFVLEALVLMLAGYVGLIYHLVISGGSSPGLSAAVSVG